jgi:hypothetical protein
MSISALLMILLAAAIAIRALALASGSQLQPLARRLLVLIVPLFMANVVAAALHLLSEL